jgi:hypothetical protein
MRVKIVRKGVEWERVYVSSGFQINDQELHQLIIDELIIDELILPDVTGEFLPKCLPEIVGGLLYPFLAFLNCQQPDRALNLPTFSHLLIVNELPSLSPLSLKPDGGSGLGPLLGGS